MLGVSFSELAITCVIAFLVMRPQDMRKVIYWYKYILKQVMEIRAIAQESIDEINKELEGTELKITPAEPEYVVDGNHKLQKTCDADPLGASDTKD